MKEIGMIIATIHSMTDKIRHFKDLLVWQKAHELALKVYKYTEKMPKTELFGITSQLRRAATSITANIAEGMGRNSYADRVRFYYNSRGSIYEVESFLITAKDLGYISEVKERLDIRYNNPPHINLTHGRRWFSGNNIK